VIVPWIAFIVMIDNASTHALFSGTEPTSFKVTRAHQLDVFWLVLAPQAEIVVSIPYWHRRPLEWRALSHTNPCDHAAVSQTVCRAHNPPDRSPKVLQSGFKKMVGDDRRLDGLRKRGGRAVETKKRAGRPVKKVSSHQACALDKYLTPKNGAQPMLPYDVHQWHRGRL
jgi:hypothetical protein